MAKLAVMNGTYIPKDVEFIDEKTGKMTENAKLSKADQVKVDLTYASISQKKIYVKTYAEAKQKKNETVRLITENAYDMALKKHIINIVNLFDEKDKPIKNGFQLADCQHPGLNDLKEDLFFRICGIRVDDEEDDGPGELNEGEELASV